MSKQAKKYLCIFVLWFCIGFCLAAWLFDIYLKTL